MLEVKSLNRINGAQWDVLERSRVKGMNPFTFSCFSFLFKFVNVFEGNTPCPQLLMNVKFLKRGFIGERLTTVLKIALCF